MGKKVPIQIHFYRREGTDFSGACTKPLQDISIALMPAVALIIALSRLYYMDCLR